MSTTNKKSPNPVDRYIGQRIRIRRMQLNMSQEKLGDELRLTFQQVQKYEKGANRVGASRMADIARVLQVPVAWFFEGAPGKDSAPSLVPDYGSAFIATREGLQIAEAFGSIRSSALRHRIAQLVMSIAENAEAA